MKCYVVKHFSSWEIQVGNISSLLMKHGGQKRGEIRKWSSGVLISAAILWSGRLLSPFKISCSILIKLLDNKFVHLTA